MSEREQLKELIYKEFPNGTYAFPKAGYGKHIYSVNGRLVYSVCSTAALDVRFTIPNKDYESPEEMYEDIKAYFNHFNPKENV